MTATVDKSNGSISQGLEPTGLDDLLPKRGTALSNKLTNILSSTYADSETRDALRLFDARYGNDWTNGEFDIRYEVQKEAIEANARIIDDFSKVAKVGLFSQV